MDVFKKPKKREINPYSWGRGSGNELSLLRGSPKPQVNQKADKCLSSQLRHLVWYLSPHVSTKDWFLNESGSRKHGFLRHTLFPVQKAWGSHYFLAYDQFNSVQSLSHSDSLWSCGLQHTQLPCPSPRSCSSSCPLSQ